MQDRDTASYQPIELGSALEETKGGDFQILDFQQSRMPVGGISAD